MKHNEHRLTREERRRKERNEMLRLLFLGWLMIAFLLAGAVLADAGKAVSLTDTEDGRIPGDNIPATQYASLDAMGADGLYTEEDENALIEAALMERAVRLDDVTVTHYDVCVRCCGKTDGVTRSGLKGTPYVTVAVDPDVIPLGSDVLVDYGGGEIHYYRADDTGGGVKGKHIDLLVDSHDEALQLGTRTATVWYVPCE